MAKMSKLVPVSDLRQDVAAVLRRLQSSREPLVITQRGRATAILMSVDAFERRENERELLELLARGEREISEGRGVSLQAVLADADKILSSR